MLFLGALLASLAAAGAVEARPTYTLFESGQVRPLALSPDGKRLFAVNTPDNRIEVFRVKQSGLIHLTSIPVGIEPVAVAARSKSEIWVVNHLSDSVSVVRLDNGGHSGRVVRTLLVGDEPRDIVFAGPNRRRAFITTAHRGQNIPFDPQLTTPGVGRADVWVFDADDLGSSLGGDPMTILTLFTDTPRALAVKPDGTRVYAAGFHTGNRTATVFESQVPDGFGPNGVPGPSVNFEGEPAPEVSLIVQHDGSHWKDALGRTWDDSIKFTLPDKDVFTIDAMADPPVEIGSFAGVGTILYNMAVNPVSGKVYVSNTEARNDLRFEGPGVFAGESLRGHLHESRITVLSGAGVSPRHLNKHIDFSTCCAPIPNLENSRSVATPTGIVVSGDGATLYTTAISSDEIAVYSTAELEDDTFVPDVADQIPVSGGGPTGLVLDEQRDRLYVLTRFDNGISIIDTDTQSEIGHLQMHNPEPPSVVTGRRFLYDASFTSSHGDSSCASCHVFADFDSLAWNLGNPDAEVIPSPGPFLGDLFNPFTQQFMPEIFHPMKGPTTTQSLRGMANHGPMHWRGDRTGGNDAPSAQPDSGSFDERAAFEKFQAGFVGLLGRPGPIPAADMEAFTDFILQVTYPPNPIRALDNSLTTAQQAGRDLFFRPLQIDITSSCIGCHTVDPTFDPGGPAHPGVFGTIGLTTFDLVPQLIKIPHLRNAYQKVGMFGFPESIGILPGFNEHTGDQVRGFGFIHDGSVDTLFRFHRAEGFSTLFPGNVNGIPATPAGDVMRRELEAFVLAFDTNLAPIVGQQVTLSPDNGAVAGPRIDLLIARAEEGECDLVVKGRLIFQELGLSYVGAGQFVTDRQSFPPIGDAALRAFFAWIGHELTYTCAPPGSGERIGIDRDGDGFLDGDERDCGSDPADPTSTP
jgi:DNA-binding beta-propeller fold protein YncE/mono/diheme cytochrome c family protein